MKEVLILIVSLLFLGCEEAKEAEHSAISTDYHTESKGRFTLEKVQSVKDYNAYSGYRSIFVLTDSKTGKEYVGVSGVGISELGSHQSGKISTSDER